MKRRNGHSAHRRHLAIFLRYPVLGGGKKRLARGIGPAAAVKFQRVRVRNLLLTLARDPRWTTWIVATPDGSGPWPSNLRCRYQGRGDLGARLSRASRTLPPGDLVIVGSDIPGILSHDIARAFAALGSATAVFGPAPDGGYWLVGIKGAPYRATPFANVRWSSEHALADTVANLPEARVAMLRTLHDVDEAADLERMPHWARRIRPPHE